jgi:hypothetical protein
MRRHVAIILSLLLVLLAAGLAPLANELVEPATSSLETSPGDSRAARVSASDPEWATTEVPHGGRGSPAT